MHRNFHLDAENQNGEEGLLVFKYRVCKIVCKFKSVLLDLTSHWRKIKIKKKGIWHSKCIPFSLRNSA